MAPNLLSILSIYRIIRLEAQLVGLYLLLYPSPVINISLQIAKQDEQNEQDA